MSDTDPIAAKDWVAAERDDPDWFHKAVDTYPMLRAQVDAMLAGAEERVQQPARSDDQAEIQRWVDDARRERGSGREDDDADVQ